jgi:hypothetical protein
MRTEEAYTELSVQLARIEAKVDKILAVLGNDKTSLDVVFDENSIFFNRPPRTIFDTPLPVTPDIVYTKEGKYSSKPMTKIVDVTGVI